MKTRLSVTIALLALAGTASACPVCDSERGAEVRAGLREDVGSVVAVAAVGLPFVVVAGVVAAVHAGPVRRKR